MAKISKRIINKHLEGHIFEVFIKTLAQTSNPDEVKNLIEDLLSPTEKVMLVKRLAIAVLLSKGYTYSQIDSSLKVSRPTIMTVSYWLKNGRSGYRKAVEKILNNQKKQTLIDDIEEIVLQITPPKIHDSIAFKKKQKQGKELFKKKFKKNSL
ncbi:MAG: hypothetical protein CO135_02705 [Candidatus Levybacteria bacterium CG_4_9_14_3_um_filter_35_16]|nr:MAG: hypothetical protein COW87_03735 [Candidatus Levybacteria bacterium CG22_combo_CG10-13_8_21_14_all_35_11]PIY94424.1 MAG: hypothetical protein COY68_02590 [Candidatus Levybacteria bacterium CG_4_10_14_0_8_um_filter_35_23]PIZ99289.1 MAG: hypothetical protein COX78_02040 [Candidatus Levybacteria bacterium CG_4_10_14_0_2_um_filter_35_8]PJA91172.1 MAG: hypothetical protein CO135_02705 [Candidatus Levybacteria bacterium CG_4_9_14_3_um_filter_35_16]PJC54050.1 MAG: hypothetical protein CO028_04